MRRKGDVPSRGEVTEKIEKAAEDMRQKEGDLQKVVSDFETALRTLEGLDFDGTSEGADEVEQSMEGAIDATQGVFEQQDLQLEQIQEESQEYESGIEERQDSSQKDHEKISESRSAVETRETLNELDKAKEGVLQDVEFLKEQAKRALEYIKESERVQQELQNRIQSGRSK